MSERPFIRKVTDQTDLLQRIRENDQQALAEFVHNELPKVFNLCLRLCRNKSDAEDLAQDVFVKAVSAIQGFKGESSFSTWLHRITVNAWKNWVRYHIIRKQSRHFSLWSKKEDDGETTSEIELPESAHGPDSWTEISDDHTRLLKALDTLDPDEKSVIVLRDMEDRSYEEISQIMGLNLGTVKSRLSRAREKLRISFHRLEGKII